MKFGNLFTVSLLGLLALVIGCNSMQTSSAILRYQQGEFEIAESLCVDALKVNPEDGEAYFYRALSQSQLQKFSEAYENFMKAGELKPDRKEMAELNIEKNWRDVYNEGVSYSRDENFEMAIEFFDLATQANPVNPKGYSNLAKAYLAKGEKFKKIDRQEYIYLLQLALENLELALPLETEDDSKEVTAVLMATVLGNLYVGSPEEEREPYLTRYREITGDLPDYYSTHEAFGYILYEEAQKNRSFYPFAGQALSQAAKLRDEQYKVAEAAEDLELMGELKEVDPSMFAGISFMTAELFSDASENFEMALAINPNDSQLWYYKEYCDYQNKNYDEAIRAATRLQEDFQSTDPEVFKILFLSHKDMAVAADEAGDRDSFLQNRTHYEDAYRTFATYKGMADTEPPILRSIAEKKAQERVENALFEKDEIAIISAWMDGRFINGTILNKREDMAEYIEISIDMLDEDGEVIDTAFAELEELEPGKEVKFSAFFSAEPDEVAGFEITEISVE